MLLQVYAHVDEQRGDQADRTQRTKQGQQDAQRGDGDARSDGHGAALVRELLFTTAGLGDTVALRASTVCAPKTSTVALGSNYLSTTTGSPALVATAIRGPVRYGSTPPCAPHPHPRAPAASTPALALPSVRPELRLSTTVTWCSSPTRRSTRCEPIKPAPPLTTILI